MERLTRKVNNGEHLSDEELMEFIILPLTYKEEDRKKIAVEKSFNLAKKLKDDDTMTFVLTGLLVFTDKIIDDELSKKVKEWIRMTKVGRLFEAEKDAAIAEKDAELEKKNKAIANQAAALASQAERIKELEALLAASK